MVERVRVVRAVPGLHREIQVAAHGLRMQVNRHRVAGPGVRMLVKVGHAGRVVHRSEPNARIGMVTFRQEGPSGRVTAATVSGCRTQQTKG